METGHHIRACCAEIPGVMKIVRDAHDNVTSLKGISAEMLDWMARAFNLTYECKNVPIVTIENTTTGIGALHYLMNHVCDVIVRPTVFRYSRFQVADFLHPWITEPALMMIPMPIFVNDSSAFAKPFNFPIWMLLLFSILVMIVMLMLLDYVKGPPGSNLSKLDLQWLFVFGSLFGRSGLRFSNKSRIRVLMAAWILAAFIMTQLYNAQLFNYIMTSVPVPIVNSAEELADNPNFDLVVADGFSPDLTIRKSDDGLMKKLAKKLDQNPIGSRCLNVQDCVELVKESKRPTVFIHQIGPMAAVMMDDYRKTGKCNFSLSEKSFDNYHQSWVVRKRDPMTELYNKGTMRMHETGLLNHWLDTYQPKPYKCLEMAKAHGDPRNPAKISLKNLSLLFGMLLFGFILSSIALICEKILFVLTFIQIIGLFLSRHYRQNEVVHRGCNQPKMLHKK